MLTYPGLTDELNKLILANSRLISEKQASLL